MAADHSLTATGLQLFDVAKRFGTLEALRGVSLEVRPGETFVLLGPSGCGKTTLLRLIAGLEQPDSGRVLFGHRDFTSVPVRKRNVGMVFQSYALFPHMQVAQNIAYGLNGRGLSGSEIKQRVAEALDLVDLASVDRRYPAQLSGGQQQRVALARALVTNPAVLLLDEPFGALDLKLRRRMQLELRQVLKRVGITAVHVTHDQEEALSLADRIAVMRDGLVEQMGTGEAVYAAPVSAFVASFLGDANLLPVEATAAGHVILIGAERIPAAGLHGDGTFACLRPERLRLSADPDSGSPLRGVVRSAVFLGDYMLYEVECNGVPLRVRMLPEEGRHIAPGAEVAVHLPAGIPLVTA